jgi:hypothetical protein
LSREKDFKGLPLMGSRGKAPCLASLHIELKIKAVNIDLRRETPARPSPQAAGGNEASVTVSFMARGLKALALLVAL